MKDYLSHIKETTLYPSSGCLITPTVAMQYSFPTNSVWVLSILYLIKYIGTSLCANTAAAVSVILHSFLPSNSPPSFLYISKYALCIRPSYLPPLSSVKSHSSYKGVVRSIMLSNSHVKKALSICKRLSIRALRLGISSLDKSLRLCFGN